MNLTDGLVSISIVKFIYNGSIREMLGKKSRSAQHFTVTSVGGRVCPPSPLRGLCGSSSVKCRLRSVSNGVGHSLVEALGGGRWPPCPLETHLETEESISHSSLAL